MAQPSCRGLRWSNYEVFNCGVEWHSSLGLGLGRGSLVALRKWRLCVSESASVETVWIPTEMCWDDGSKDVEMSVWEQGCGDECERTRFSEDECWVMCVWER